MLEAMVPADPAVATQTSAQLYPVITLHAAGHAFKMIAPAQTRASEEITGQFFERPLIEDILTHLIPGDSFWDVGAATGTHTIPVALKLGNTGHVYSFEPDDAQVKLLKENCRLNAIATSGDALHIVPLALWGEDAPLTLHTSGLTGKAPRVTIPGKSANTPYATFDQQIQTQARSVASLVTHDGYKAPDVMKIDVEGVGMQVLRGLGLLRPRTIYLEVHPLYDKAELGCPRFLRAIGYAAGLQQERGRQILYRFDRVST